MTESLHPAATEAHPLHAPSSSCSSFSFSNLDTETLLASIGFMIVFVILVTVVQGLLHLEGLQKRLPFLSGVLKSKFIIHIVTGYLPSVVLVLFLYTVPPTMYLFSTIEGAISRSSRKKSACCKVLYFLIWNVFFVNVLSGKVIKRLSVVSSPKDVTAQLATTVPTQATFFVTYILSSGWASFSFELLQPYALLCNLFYKFILRNKEDPCTLALFIAIYLELATSMFYVFILFINVIYILNVYVTIYESGGKYWPIMHNTTIFSLVLTQIIAIGVFGLKESIVASTFTIPLIILTLLFNEYCRHMFYPIFKDDAAQVLIELDRKDELYIPLSHCENRDGNTRLQDLEDIKPGNLPIQSWMKTLFLGRFYSVHNFVANLQQNDLRTEVLGICADCRGGYDID
ncbi:CSC1-like protein RXW8 [Camellia lanceoleosa]|uniref:CSC1-like protein RXW8 n=1 Tax=Camellia lanceoleosa TaxID=1840588 RepID=A0ACC0GW29_9ERIC|nr:CSC1-like protein RXW8 [Camellia lanceoleosa]